MFKNSLFILLTILLLATYLHANNNCTSLYKVTVAKLNIRDQANTSGNIIGTLYKDDKVCFHKRHQITFYGSSDINFFNLFPNINLMKLIHNISLF